jgi:hypothetical protein
MRLGRFVPAALAAAATLLILSGATAAATSPSLSSPKSIHAYLRSIGVNPASMVWQHGARNYAGPNCPGKGWTCTTSTRVVQAVSDNGQNRVDCTGTSTVSASTQSCVVMQMGSNNNARCFERSKSSVVAQDCNIKQTGDRNTALIDQSVETNGDPTQDATQTAEVTQTGTLNNRLSVKQHVHQHVESGDTQTEDAHQDLTASQTATGAGDNASSVKQDQNQDAHQGVTQLQNTNHSSTAPCPAATLFGVGSDPNQCAYVGQSADAGDNQNVFDQSVDEDANSNSATDQAQGSFSGGIKAQAELTSATGSSVSSAGQHKSQTEKGPSGASQEQIDPMSCCGVSAQGNDQSSETLDQSSTQNASEGSAAVQELLVLGFVHAPTGGSCSVTQRASDNADSSSESAASPTCASGLGFLTNCTSGQIPDLTEDLAAPLQQEIGGCTSRPFNPID